MIASITMWWKLPLLCSEQYYCSDIHTSSFFAHCEMNKELGEESIEIKDLAGKGVENPRRWNN